MSSELQQEEGQRYDTEKHKHVDEEEHPAAAVQPVGQRSSARRSGPEGSGPSDMKQRSVTKALNTGADLPAHRKSVVNVLTPFIFVCFFLRQRGRAPVPLSHYRRR